MNVNRPPPLKWRNNLNICLLKMAVGKFDILIPIE